MVHEGDQLKAVVVIGDQQWKGWHLKVLYREIIWDDIYGLP